MFEILKIRLFGLEPAAKITDEMLDRLIEREFISCADKVRQKLEQVRGVVPTNNNRICAAILKLANKNYKAIDRLIEFANYD